MPNRLATESSPYLRQHQDNPVDWYPWGEEAFARARTEDKPIFLSVGYASCHWCHVMEHESFEDADVAAILNRDFISVKVDREERPDVDEAYMTAVQLTSGRGGWPMSVFLTPDRKPFFAGTYFPKLDRGQYLGFLSLVRQIGTAWRTRRADVDASANQIAGEMRTALTARAPGTFTALDAGFLQECVIKVIADFDPQQGGFGAAPKFPPHSALELMFDYAERANAPSELRQACLTAALFTLQQISRGGIHDHVGGGFHRYATDGEWLLPHFEKMLYDNALLLGAYGRALPYAARVGPELEGRFRMAAEGIVGWLEREMVTPEGAYACAIDADSEGEEGRFYVWSVDEVREVLGDSADAFLETYRFDPAGNFEDEATRQRTGMNIPHLGEEGEPMPEAVDLLLARRESRVRPIRDDKALVSWNGLAMQSLIRVGRADLAVRVASAILSAEAAHGSLPHQIAAGRPSGTAFLDDYANFALGLLDLGDVLSDAGVRAAGERIGREMIARFFDAEEGGFYGTHEGHEVLFGRTKPVFDQPIPSATSAAIRVALELGDEEVAIRSLQGCVGWMERAPQATEALIATALISVPDVPVEAELAAPVAAPTEVTVAVSAREIVVDGDGVGRCEVRIQVPEGLHLNSDNPPARWLVPTRVTAKPIRAEIRYPVATNDRFEGDVRIAVEFRLAPDESEREFELVVSYQACTERECQAPAERNFGMVALRG